MSRLFLATAALAATPKLAGSQAAPGVGPSHGSVIVVGGGQIGPDILSRFIAAAGGPDALIIDVPTAGGDTVYPANWRGASALKNAGLPRRLRRLAMTDR